MDLSEIFGYTIEGVKWLSMGGGSYIGALIGHSLLLQSTLFFKKIQSQDELEKIVDEECKNLDLNPNSFDVKFVIGDGIGPVIKKNGERFEVNIKEGLLATRPSVKHELYHIKRDLPHTNKEGKLGNFYYLFIAEPRAKLYATTGIRL